MQHGSLPTQRITGTLWGLLGASSIRLPWCAGQVQKRQYDQFIFTMSREKVDSGFAGANHMWFLSLLLLKLFAPVSEGGLPFFCI